jgi:hypothetical protein
LVRRLPEAGLQGRNAGLVGRRFLYDGCDLRGANFNFLVLNHLAYVPGFAGLLKRVDSLAGTMRRGPLSEALLDALRDETRLEELA